MRFFLYILLQAYSSKNCKLKVEKSRDSWIWYDFDDPKKDKATDGLNRLKPPISILDV